MQETKLFFVFSHFLFSLFDFLVDGDVLLVRMASIFKILLFAANLKYGQRDLQWRRRYIAHLFMEGKFQIRRSLRGMRRWCCDGEKFSSILSHTRRKFIANFDIICSDPFQTLVTHMNLLFKFHRLDRSMFLLSLRYLSWLFVCGWKVVGS